MEKLLIKGDVYTVATKTECTVTSANGTPLGTATAEAPYTFTATTDRVILSDPDAEFARVNPKYAPVKLRLLGLLGGGASTGSALPAGYLAAEWLETHQPVAIGVPVNKPLAGYCIEQSHAYSSDVTGGEAAVTWNTSQRVQIGQWDKKNLFVWVFRSQAGGSYLPDTKKTIKVDVAADGAKIYLDDAFLFEQQGEVSGTVTSFNLFSRQSTEVFSGKKYWVKMRSNGELIRDLVPCISPEGKPAFYDKVSKTHYAASNTESYIAGMTCKQALKLAELPAGGGEITVSLPWDAQFADTGVPDALQIAADKGWVITVQYRDGAECERYSRYATCKTVADVAAINPNFRTDLTAAGGWVYPLPELTNLANLAWGGNYSPDMPVKYVDCDAPKVKLTNPGFVHNCQPEWARGDWSGVENGMWMFGAGHKKVLSNVGMVFPKLHTGNAMFEGAILNKESVLRILGSIPSYSSGSHILTIGIHVDHEFDEEIAAAIADAESRGWNIEEQWNGTATAQAASTWGLRRKPIYAKLGTMALPDGTTGQYLAWGHYVTNWEQNGYQEFSSVEEATEHFNIGD